MDPWLAFSRTLILKPSKANSDLEIYEIKLLASHHLVEGLYKHFSEFGLVSHIYESEFEIFFVVKLISLFRK